MGPKSIDWERHLEWQFLKDVEYRKIVKGEEKEDPKTILNKIRIVNERIVDIERYIEDFLSLIREIGNLKCFNKKRGYGFIVHNDGSNDLFVNLLSIRVHEKDPKSLKMSQIGKYDVKKTKKGPRAINVEILGSLCITTPPRQISFLICMK